MEELALHLEERRETRRTAVGGGDARRQAEERQEAGCRWLGVFRSMTQAILGNMVTGAIVKGVSCLLG